MEEHVTDQHPVDEQSVRLLARAAALPLDDKRLPAAAELLDTWLVAANELSRIMSAPEHLAVLPVTVFAHPTPEPTD